MLDVLHPQIHGDSGRPGYLPSEVELLTGDLRDPAVVRRALEGVTAVVHLAARVGVGQSMTDMVEYSSTNVMGTATLLSELADSTVERLVVASSMSVYGEGAYAAPDGRLVSPPARDIRTVTDFGWDPLDARGLVLTAVPTPETQPAAPTSMYAVDKLHQEQACLIFGRSRGIPVTGLRLFNVYGPFQALSNPYTGVIVNLAVRILNGQRPIVFEDGNQRRDFVHVDDVARAFALALARGGPDVEPDCFNIGSGHSATVAEVASLLADLLQAGDLTPDVTHEYRSGDIRHCFADVTRAEQNLGFTAEMTLADGLAKLIAWLRENSSAPDRMASMHAALVDRGLVRRR